MANNFSIFEEIRSLIVSLSRFFITLVISLLIVSSCRRSVKLPETIEANYIRYDIEYLEKKAGDIPTRILPAQMDAYYTDYYILTRIEGFFNQFSLIQIANLRQRKVTTLLNFFGNKVYYTGSRGELPAGIVQPEKLDIQFTGEYSLIGGLNSERINIDTGIEVYSIYCTREFQISRPNITTPYHSVEYPLSDFRIQLSLLKMHLSCSDFETKPVESEIFTIPADYRQVSRPAMEQIINNLFTKE